jgi:predicted amidohydrolase YtcJ
MINIIKNIAGLLLLLSSATYAHAQTADIILFNGKIFTSDEKNLYVNALAIKGNKILATGTSESVDKYRGTNTQWIDLKGKTVTPGFNDAHYHLEDGFNARTIRFSSMDPSWETLLDSLRIISSQMKNGEWIQAKIGPSIANSPGANRVALDSITTSHPVRLLSFWGHVGIYNTIGLKSMGISETQAEPKGGRYERMPDGVTLTGKCFEWNAIVPGYSKLTSFRDDDAFIGYLKGISQAFLHLGITSVQNMCTGATAAEYIKYFKIAGLPFRLRLIRWGYISPEGNMLVPGSDLPPNDKDLPLLSVFGTKWLLDGTPIEGGAAVTEGYVYNPKHVGYLNFSRENIRSFLDEGLKRNDQLCFHVAGDSTLNTVIDVMEKMNVDWKPKRVRIEHGDGLLPAQFENAKKLGIIVVQNPSHFDKNSISLLRGNMSKTGFRFLSLLKAGIPVAIGSDGPFNPFLNIMLAVTDPPFPDEAMSREQAVIAYTLTSAYAEFQEEKKGTLTAGKLADLAVLSQDIFTVPVRQLLNTRSVLTIIDGKIAFKEE